jgi:hypothetical protein
MDPPHNVMFYKELLHKELLQTNLLQKKLILSGLKVPLEIIRIIKDYTFMDITMSKTKKHKNRLAYLIGNTKWCGKKRPLDEENGLTLFWIQKDNRSPQFQIKFCTKCGDYIGHTLLQFEGQFDKVACRC